MTEFAKIYFIKPEMNKKKAEINTRLTYSSQIQCAFGVFVISGKPEGHPKIFIVKKKNFSKT